MRINKYLADKDICSRREADRLIQAGKVIINEKVASLGDQVGPEDVVKVIGEAKKYRYYAYHKPRGVITHSPQGEEQSIQDLTNLPEDVFPIGRLDKDSYGLIILTNDGRVTKHLLDPSRELEKEYLVQVNKPVTQRLIQHLINGVVLEDGYKTKECSVRKVDENTLRIILTEGKKHQIRRMLDAYGYKVTELMRVRVGHIELENLQPGELRKIAKPF